MTTSSHEPAPVQIAIEGFQLGDPTSDDMTVVYDGCGDIGRTGEDFAAVQIRIGIDGWFDKISVDAHQCGDLDLLDRAITSLVRVRNALAGLYEGRERRAGRCLAVDENGRCDADSDHTEGDHVFPTAAQAATRARSAVALIQQTKPLPA